MKHLHSLQHSVKDVRLRQAQGQANTVVKIYTTYVRVLSLTLQKLRTAVNCDFVFLLSIHFLEHARTTNAPKSDSHVLDIQLPKEKELNFRQWTKRQRCVRNDPAVCSTRCRKG